MDEASLKIKNLVNYYHETNKNEELTTSSQVTPAVETRGRKQSLSDRKVTFSVSDDVETAVEPDYQDEDEVSSHLSHLFLSTRWYSKVQQPSSC